MREINEYSLLWPRSTPFTKVKDGTTVSIATPVKETYGPPAFRSSGTKWRSGAIPAASASYHLHSFN
ncbi:MAG: hypothetical protein IKO93_19995 [Lentisphaeria bacterium]|nr:hypothetical protein [Lentisphaeria bacterium]